MHLVFTHTPGESYHRQLRSLLLCLCDAFRALINSLVCCSLILVVDGSVFVHLSLLILFVKVVASLVTAEATA